MRFKTAAVVNACSGLLAGAALFLGGALWSQAAELPPASSNISLKAQGHGWVLTDSQGLTLYTYARDVEPGKSGCIEDCAKDWPPYLAAVGAAPEADWTIIAREDGSKQWAYRDKPLYRYSVDKAPGDTYGEGVRALWYLAFAPIATPPGIKIQKTLLGYVAANNERNTLYTPSPRDGIESAALCVDDSCGSEWQPLTAPWAARDLDDWAVLARADGFRQWAYKGQPLFAYVGDVHPREFNGDGARFDAIGSPWRAVVLQTRPPYPDWVTVNNTDAGEMLANLDGKTIYTYDLSRLFPALRIIAEACKVDCLAAEWIPALAMADEKAQGGNWAVNALSDGSRQWAYKGRPLYTNIRDKSQGSFLGYRHGGNRAWNVIMHSEDALVGTLRPP